MRWLQTLALLALAAWPAAAQENEAEKLFRGMEKKLRTAKTLQLRFDSSVTIPPNTGSVKGTLILGDGDKLRLELGGKPFGVEFKLTVVSDGTTMSSKDSTEPNKDKTQKAPKALGANVREALPLLGVFICINGIDRGNWSPGVLKVSDFKLAGKEKVGEQTTQVIEYTVTEMKDVISPGKWRMKMWLDAQTHLPVKLTMTMDELADISATTDTFSEFAIDGKVDAKLFELPNGPARKNPKEREKQGKSHAARLRAPAGPTLTMQARTDQRFGTIFFSADGKRLAGVTVPGHIGEPAIFVWNAATGKRLFTRSWHKKAALSVRFNDDGRLLVASAPLPSEKSGEVQLWDPVTMKSLRTLAGADAGPVTFSPDGKLVTATGGQPAGLGLWDVSTGKKILALEGNATPITFSPDGKLLTGIDVGGRGQVWNVATGKVIQTLEGKFAGGEAFSLDSKRVAGGVGILGVNVGIWEVASGRKLLELRDAHVKGVVSVAFSPDGKRLVTGGNRQHKSIFPEFLPAERDGEVKVWDATTGIELLAFSVTDSGGLGCMCLAPDGERVAVSPASGASVTIWTLASAASGEPEKAAGKKPVDAPKEDAAKKEMAKLQGSWQQVGAEVFRAGAGFQGPKEEVELENVIIKGDNWTLRREKMLDKNGIERNEIHEKARYQLDAAKKPNAIDLVWTEGDNKGKTYPGIYSLEGDTLKICYAREGTERPTGFTAEATKQIKDHCVLRVLKREKRSI